MQNTPIKPEKVIELGFTSAASMYTEAKALEITSLSIIPSPVERANEHEKQKTI